MSADRGIAVAVNRVTVESGDWRPPEVGSWYWVLGSKPGDRWLGCVVELGTNYARLRGPAGRGHYESRIHFDVFDAEATPEPDPERFISQKVALYQGEARRLMGEVKALTASLAVRAEHRIEDGDAPEAGALALRTDGQSIPEYEAALVRAKDETLPKLFDEIRGGERDGRLLDERGAHPS